MIIRIYSEPRKTKFGTNMNRTKIMVLFKCDFCDKEFLTNRSIKRRIKRKFHFCFYVESHGEYWHGLNRPIEEIKNSTNRQSKAIYENYLRDIKQNIYAKEHNLKFIRITDKELQKYNSSCDLSILINVAMNRKLRIEYGK